MVASAKEGDRIAFEALMHMYGEGVYRLALRMLGNYDDAADVQQEAFIAAYRSLRKFRGESSFATWLYRITARLCLARKQRKAAVECAQLPEDLPAPLSAAGDPLASLLAREAAGQVLRALYRLCPQDRLLIILRYLEELGHQQIGEILGCSEECSRTRVLRARRRFCRIFDDLR